MIAEAAQVALFDSPRDASGCTRACSRSPLERAAQRAFWSVCTAALVFSAGCFAYAAVGEAQARAGWAGEPRASSAARRAPVNVTTYPTTTYPTATLPTTTLPAGGLDEAYTTMPAGSEAGVGEVAKSGVDEQPAQEILTVSIVSV